VQWAPAACTLAYAVVLITGGRLGDASRGRDHRQRWVGDAATPARPARSAPANVELPRGLLISIDAIAALPA
jgi:hypothetical protein